MSGKTIELEGLKKQFGDVEAVKGISTSIESGEFFSLVGPSGCGKTTTLRMIAGLETLSAGTIRVAGEDQTELPPNQRDAGMVFQDYALFPHKTVGENIKFGLKMEGIPRDERDQQAQDVLDLINLTGFEDRYPEELSGGQQQRVALARAIVFEPDVLLLDEPLSNLDKKLRDEMRFELKRIQDNIDVTTIYVTHNQEEALSLSDRVLVMNKGRIEQLGTPKEIYNRPANEFVASFIGEANIFAGQVQRVQSNQVTVELDDFDQGPLTAEVDISQNAPESGPVSLLVRPEEISISPEDQNGSNVLEGSVQATSFLGNSTQLLVDVEGSEILVELTGSQKGTLGASQEGVRLRWAPSATTIIN